MAARFDGKVALITGGGAGIGRTTARAFAAEGAHVVVGDRDLPAARAVVDEVDGRGTAVAFDATDPSSIEALIDMAVETYGRLDILHNNVAMTGSAWATDTTVLETSLETWDLTMTTNLRSMFIACKAALPYMLEQRTGSIVNMSSRAGFIGKDALVAYGTSKGAVFTLTQYLAVQYGRYNVRTNCVAPGPIMTEQLLEHRPELEVETLASLPFPRVGRPEDVAGVVLALASDELGFVNGQLIHCDGGGSAGQATLLDPAVSSR